MSSEADTTLGPYRVLERLGRGGMGEVFLAHDPRLERRVAIKRIRPDAARGAEARERFRREARLAAGLSHPGIVKVFDLVTTPDGAEHIVMEHVPGESLRQVLEGRRVPMGEGLRLATRIAEALAYAHRHGVVHRDLKSENVLLDAEGQPQIVDFGIAAGRASAAAGSLTRDGAVLGTWRAMSPEQARGETVDARSDLFSLGVLLYELFTGVSPFLGASAAETASRVLEHRQRPARERVPELPEDLSRLIDHLLEKDPLARPRGAGEVAARLEALSAASDAQETLAAPPAGVAADAPDAGGPDTGAPDAGSTSPTLPSRRRRAAAAVAALVLAALAVGTFVAWRPPLRYVAVLRPELQGPAGEGSELLAFTLRNAAVRTLLSLEGLSVKTAAAVDAVAGSPREVALAVAADEVLTTALSCRARDCYVELERIRAADDSVVWNGRVEVPLDQPLTAARALAVTLRQGYEDHAARPGRAELEVAPEDFATFLEIQRTFETAPDTPGLLERLAAVRRGSDRFVDAYLLEATIAARRFHESNDPALLERAFELVDLASELAPDDPEVLFLRSYVEIHGGRPSAAEATLRALEEQAPGDVRILLRRASLLERRGEPEEALDLYRRAVARRPAWDVLYNQAFLALRLGQRDEARASLERILELSPGNQRALSLLARLELLSGDAGRAVELYEELVAGAPNPIDLTNLGVAHLLLRRYAAAARRFEQAAATAPDNPFYQLNLADARWLQGERGEAEELYGRVVDLLARDPRATGWQHLTVRAQALAHLGEPRSAAAIAEEAARLAPEEAQAAFEISLIYALVGDRERALVHAERAIGLGLGAPAWFGLPWFDEPGLRAGLDRLLAAGVGG